MKKISLFVFFLFLSQTTVTNFIFPQWLAGDRFSDTSDQELPPHIQFNSQNLGWEVHPAQRDSVSKTTNGGINWTAYTTGDTNRMSGLFFIDNNTGWVVGQRGKIAKSTNGGTSWIMQSSGVQSWLNSVYFIDANTGYIVGSKDSNRVVLKTTNGGSVWQILLRNNLARLYSVWATSSQSVYCVGDSGSVIYSSNGGISWTNQSSGTGATLRDVIFKNYSSFSLGWIAGKNGTILTTSNGGTTWISRSFNTVNFFGIDFSPNAPDSGYVCGRGRIYKTINGGINWTQQTIPVPDTVNIKDIFCISSKNVWAVPWSGNLIYTLNGGVTSVEPISSEIPTQLSLSQNYPNPFNPDTKIRFEINKSDFVKLTVFDITGRTLAILVNEDLSPGVYETTWDASHRPSGLYYYRLETQSISETKKMILLK